MREELLKVDKEGRTLFHLAAEKGKAGSALNAVLRACRAEELHDPEVGFGVLARSRSVHRCAKVI